MERGFLNPPSLILVSFPTNRLAVLTAQLNERRAPLFRPNSGQAAGPRQGNRWFSLKEKLVEVKVERGSAQT